MGQYYSTTPQYGYHILQVAPNSPAMKAGLIPFFDFIVSINELDLNSRSDEDSTFYDIISQNLHQEVNLGIYNSRNEEYRHAILVPDNTWGGAGAAGMSIRYCPYEQAHEHVWHILDIHPNSPAEKAGLEPHTDYIVGSPDVIFGNCDEFYSFISGRIDKPTPLYVFSTKSDLVRMVNITPSKTWGGKGSLGCDIGYGVIHRIPSVNTKTTMESTSENSVTKETKEEEEISVSGSSHTPNTPRKEIINSKHNPFEEDGLDGY
eukprot:TRINITY_DN3757_c0_g1_i1.p1 TRINITY_DN3757_c0_g1~~TRINITY_DN3757_c0_g1_i1.p1  ORF type:complete len:262 (-),score=46.78 TRINITY_DN3757_c0_g1_i1:39-824(-)